MLFLFEGLKQIFNKTFIPVRILEYDFLVITMKRYNPYFYPRLMLLSAALLLSTVGWAQETTGDASGTATNQVPDDPESITEGQSLFGQHCTVCHAVGKQVIGPALASVQNRRPIDWLVKFIQNSQHVIIDEEDEYAQYLYQQYEKQVMPNFEFLSRGEILNILAYIQVESSSATSGVSSNNAVQADMAQNNAVDESEASSTVGATPETGTSILTIVLVGVILVLMVIIIVLAARNRAKTNA